MKATPDSLPRDLAALYDEPISDADAIEMADRLIGLVALLMQIEEEKG